MTTERLAVKLGFGRRLLLAAIGVAAVAGPFVFGFVDSQCVRAQSKTNEAMRPSFEVASIKSAKTDMPGFAILFHPGSFTARNVTAKHLIAWAYNNQRPVSLEDYRISGGPDWINSEMFVIDAKVEDSLVKQMLKLPAQETQDLYRLMVQSLLADRFKLKVHHETKELPVYALVLAKGGPKFAEVKATRPPATPPPPQPTPSGNLQWNSYMPFKNFALVLSWQPELRGRLVLDKTGLQGSYNFTLHWTPASVADSEPWYDSSGPSLFTALQEQLGLRLESTKGPLDTIVIDSIEEPSAN